DVKAIMECERLVTSEWQTGMTMSDFDDNLVRATAGIRDADAPAVNDDLIARLERVPWEGRGHRSSRTKQLVAACLVIGAVGLVVWFVLCRPESSAFAQTVQALRQTKTFTAKVTAAMTSIEIKAFVKGHNVRTEMIGSTNIANRDDGVLLEL